MKGKKEKKKKERHTKIERFGRTTKALSGQGQQHGKGKLTVTLN